MCVGGAYVLATGLPACYSVLRRTDLLQLAEIRLGKKYVNVVAPKDNPNWYDPWDCVEFVS